MRLNAVHTVVLMAQLGISAPLESAMSKASIAEVSARASAVDAAVMQSCQAQSCALADASGSTGKDPVVMPEGANSEDMKCVFKYNRRAEQIMGGFGGQTIPKVPKQDTGVSTSLFSWLASWERPNERKNGETDKGNFTGTCAPNILIFAKGTLEPTQYGVTMGPKFTAGWDKNWSVSPVLYEPTVAADFCLALPGGMVLKDMINQAANKCPTSNIYVSGFSQGAMVVHNGVAYADETAKARVKGVIVFGDPMNGASIKGYSGPIKTFCKPGDGVCGGNFELSTAHLSYPFDNTAAEAKEYLKDLAAKNSPTV